MCLALAAHGAAAVTWVQLAPSGEDQTSLRTLLPFHPPITQILLLKTTELCSCLPDHIGAPVVTCVQRPPLGEDQTSLR